MGNNILVVAAHPDDEILGCGASIAQHISGGDRVCVLILGEGVAARRQLTEEQKEIGISAVLQAARAASNFLGVENLEIRQFPDNSFDSVPLLDIVSEVEEEIRFFHPEVIYTHNYSDVNIDHRLVAEAVEAATRPMEGSSIRRVLSFEIPSSTEWNFIKGEFFRPNVFLNVTKYFEKKITALEFYQHEMRDFPHPRSYEYIRSLARVRGGQAGFLYAEAFQLVYEKIV